MMDPDEERRQQPRAQSNNDQQEEGILGKISRSVSNCCLGTGLCCFKFKERTQIQGLEYRITKRQKQFGTDYLTLVENGAQQDELKACLREALNDIGEIQKGINVHHDAIDEKEREVNEQIQATPASGNVNQKKESREVKPPQEEDLDPEYDNSHGNQAAEEPDDPKPKKKKKKKKKKPAEDSNFSIDDE